MTQPNFADLLISAVNDPGRISASFRAFHNYSFGNQLLAYGQIMERGLPLGPIASFMAWKDKGRHVCKGQKALILCMPVTAKRTVTKDDGTEETATFARFVFRPNWFTLAQTEGAELTPEPTPAFDMTRALVALDVTEKAFDLMNGNVFGYAKGRTIAINPIAPGPTMTRLHEIAHIVLGHTVDNATFEDGATMDRSERELEAECVAFLCGSALELSDLESSRGYIQAWWGQGRAVPERNAQRIAL